MTRSRFLSVASHWVTSWAISTGPSRSSTGPSFSIRIWQWAWYASGTVRAFRGGEPDVAIEHLKRAMRLSPFDPLMFTMQGVTAFAHFFAGRYDEAVAWAERAFWERPNILATLRIAAASYALAGRAEEAQKAVARALELDPGMRVSNLKERIGWFGRPEDFAKYADALRKAGLPE